MNFMRIEIEALRHELGDKASAEKLMYTIAQLSF